MSMKDSASIMAILRHYMIYPLKSYPKQVTALIGPSGCGRSTFL